MNAVRKLFSALLCLGLALALCAAAGAQGGEDKIAFPNGLTVDAEAESLDLSALKEEDLEQALAGLAQMKKLKRVELGEERGEELSWDAILQLEEAAPQAAFDYRFTLYGRSFSLQDKEMDLNHTGIYDGGELVRQVIACMPRLNYLCMDSCGVSNEDMAAIRDDFPNIEVVWRIWFGNCYSVRTNVEKILASQAGIGGNLTSEELNRTIVYCTKLKYLDLGHNLEIRDISFLNAMPEMEVLILAINHLGDISPIANCPKLEYLELFMSDISDLSPLKDLKELRHLNISDCPEIRDISPLFGLDLERLSLGAVYSFPPEQIEEFKSLHPDCWVDDYGYDASQGGWRWSSDYDDDPDYKQMDYYIAGCHPRYALLRQQFGYRGDYSDYSFTWLDPNY